MSICRCQHFYTIQFFFLGIRHKTFSLKKYIALCKLVGFAQQPLLCHQVFYYNITYFMQFESVFLRFKPDSVLKEGILQKVLPLKEMNAVLIFRTTYEPLLMFREK